MPKSSASDADMETVDSDMTLEAIPFTSKPVRRIPASEKPSIEEKVSQIDCKLWVCVTVSFSLPLASVSRTLASLVKNSYEIRPFSCHLI